MAAITRGKFWRRIGVIFALIGLLWGLAIWGHSSDVASAKAQCKKDTAALTSPSPVPTPTLKPGAKPSASVNPSASVKASGVIVPLAAATPAPSTSPKPSPNASPTEAPVSCDNIPKFINLGLDLQGGISVVLEPKPGEKFDKDSLDQAVVILGQRVDALGVAEPEISRQGDRQILVELPGLKDPASAITALGTTAQLQFRPVLGQLGPTTKVPPGTKVPTCGDPTTYPPETETTVILCARQKDSTGADTLPATWPKYVLGPVKLQGKDISSAAAVLPSSTTTGAAGWEVSLKLTGPGHDKFQKITGDLACNQGVTRELAIVLDEVVESHPQAATDVKCHEGISSDTAQITGSFSEKEAKSLSLVLKFGALPVTLVRATTTTISPTLGRESLNGGLLAGAIGLGIVFLYVLMFYRALGLIIWIGITVHASLTMVVVVLLGQSAGFALSLAGIAGLIVSLGVATDSFIVYFERIKDEVHHGKTVRSGVDRAWTSAWRTIFAADMVTALAAGVLYLLAVGSVRGFALMLGLATALDLFVSRLYMHPAVWLLAHGKRLEKTKSLGIGSGAGFGVAQAGEAR